MAVRKTVQIGDPVLRETAQLVENIDDPSLRELVCDLKDTMREEDLVGIAAPQLGESVRIIVSEIRHNNLRNAACEPFCVYINPEIVSVSHETELGWEGCGSVAHSRLFARVARAREITLQYMDGSGVSRENKASGLLARIIQHEIDHLDGILFTDICNPLTLVSREHYLKHIVGK